MGLVAVYLGCTKPSSPPFQSLSDFDNIVTGQSRAEAIKTLLKYFKIMSREPLVSIQKLRIIMYLDSITDKVSGDIVFIAILAG